MNEYYRELSQKIESGEYFSEAREWYLKNYIYKFTERTYLIILVCFFLFLLLVLDEYRSAISPIVTNWPVQVTIQDSAEEYSKISYLGNKNKNFDINEILIKYFSARFVEAIESYNYKEDFKKLKKNSKIIEKLGSALIQEYYEKKTSIRSSDSLIIAYRQNVIRDIFVDSKSIKIKKVTDNKNSFLQTYKLSLEYKVRETHKKEGTTISNWASDLEIKFETVRYIRKEKQFNDLNFKVYDYETRKIN